MVTNTKFSLLKIIGNVYEKAEGSKLEDSFFKKIDTDLTELSEYFKVNKMQTFFLANIFVMNYKGDTVNINDLIKYFACNPIKVLEHSDDFKALYSKGILKKQKSEHRVKVALINDQFTIDENITEAILNNILLPEFKKENFEDIVDLLGKLYDIGSQRDNKEISTQELFSQTKSIIQSNQNFTFIKKVCQMNLDISDAYLFLYLVWKTLTGNKKTDIERAVDGIFERHSERIKYKQKILSNENELIKRKLIEIQEARFFNDTEMKLSDYSIKMLQEEGIKIFENKTKNDNIIEPQKIGLKKLFYNDEEEKQLCLLKKLLKNPKLIEMQNRLKNKNFPKGITVLLYGFPGTGKTETVYQIAKNTKREIMMVNISQSKSMWHGESEKIIKRIFTDYEDYAKYCELTPILLFNEADAIISKRRELTSTNNAQTENTIQNIILEELEKFDGILFATTNLVDNLDSAFERRFLFKIEFQKPDISVKTKIWKSKLQKLSSSESNILANRFDFSGGQIDNIVKKSEMYEIINGTTVTINNIIEFCETENISKYNRVKIGYTIN